MWQIPRNVSSHEKLEEARRGFFLGKSGEFGHWGECRVGIQPCQNLGFRAVKLIWDVWLPLPSN